MNQPAQFAKSILPELSQIRKSLWAKGFVVKKRKPLAFNQYAHLIHNKIDRHEVEHKDVEGVDYEFVLTTVVLWKGPMRFVGYHKQKFDFNRKIGFRAAFGQALQALREYEGTSHVRNQRHKKRYSFDTNEQQSTLRPLPVGHFRIMTPRLWRD